MTRDELVEKMLNGASVASRLRAIWPDTEGRFSAERIADIRRQMSAALDVARDELLKEMEEDEWNEHIAGPNSIQYGVNAIFTARRAKLERVKTPAERVTIHATNESTWHVSIDGRYEFGGFTMYKQAITYRLGLIQTLKEQP